MKIKHGVTYWGREGNRQVEKRVDLIETRSAGTEYVKWTRKKKDGSDGKQSWTRRDLFASWVQGIYELEVTHES